MNLDNKLFKVCYDLLNNHDSVWMRRNRKLNTKTIFEYLVNGAITNMGISTCVNVQQQFSHVAMIKARKKLDTKIFFDINKLRSGWIFIERLYLCSRSIIFLSYNM